MNAATVALPSWSTALREWRSAVGRANFDRIELCLDKLTEGEYPSYDDILDLRARGIARIYLDDALRLDSARGLLAVRFLRDCLTHGMPVSWALGHASFDTSAICHVAVPRNAADAQPWISAPDASVLQWRRGPGFIIIKDYRTNPNGSRFTIADSDLLAVFEKTLTGSALSPAEQTCAQPMIDERLIIGIDAFYLALPARYIRWPIRAM